MFSKKDFLRTLKVLSRFIKMSLDMLTPDGYDDVTGILKQRCGDVVKITNPCRLEHVSGGKWRHVAIYDMFTPLSAAQDVYSTFTEGVVIKIDQGVCTIRITPVSKT